MTQMTQENEKLRTSVSILTANKSAKCQRHGMTSGTAGCKMCLRELGYDIREVRTSSNDPDSIFRYVARGKRNEKDKEVR